jgi:hypothetical protein
MVKTSTPAPKALGRRGWPARCGGRVICCGGLTAGVFRSRRASCSLEQRQIEAQVARPSAGARTPAGAKWPDLGWGAEAAYLFDAGSSRELIPRAKHTASHL